MADRFVVDSSVFVAFYFAGDISHENALQILGDLDNKTLIVHPYVIQETATVLTYKLGLHVAVQFLTDIENAANVIIPYIDTREDIKNFILIKKKISFTDSALVHLAKAMNAQIVTFDRQMLSLFRS